MVEGRQATDRTSEWGWFYHLLRPHAGRQIAAASFLLGATILSLVDPLILKWLIDDGLRAGRNELIAWVVCIFVVVYGIRISFVALGTLMSNKTMQLVTVNLRLRILRKLLALGGGFYDQAPVGDLIQRVEQDVDLTGEIGRELFPTFLRIIVSIISTMSIMCVLNARLSCVVLPCLPICLCLRSRFRQLLERAADGARDAVGERSSFLSECLHGVVQIQLLQIERVMMRKYCRYAVRAAKMSRMQSGVEVLYLTIWLGVFAVITALILSLGAHQVLRDTLTLGGYVAFYGYAMRLFEPLGFAVDAYSRLKRAGGSVRRIMQVDTFISPSPCGTTTLGESGIRELSCQQVNFRYHEDRALLQNVTFRIAIGEKVALIGPSGSGKTTVAKLLVRLCLPDTGVILLDGVDVASIDLAEFRQTISLVCQNPFLFRGTIRENVTFGINSAREKTILHLAYLTCFDTVVSKFPSGWNHTLGPNGAGLSDGEKQRLSLLRSLLQDRPLLILDEATSALDPLLEEELLRRLDKHMVNKAVLIISHRVSAVRWADKALVLHKSGRVAFACRPKELDERTLQLEMQLWPSGAEGAHAASDGPTL